MNIDIIIDIKTNRGTEIYIVEYKGNGGGNDEVVKRADDQLAIAGAWYGRYTNTPLENIHTKVICGNDPKYKDKLKKYKK